ncbi:RICIN domain-containing protein [Streptomyces syringium]|uniref:RICIN domain-containing protein n=1 Tax=Streptomyces syringium TaxID=76729 RepID=UPI003665129A
MPANDPDLTFDAAGVSKDADAVAILWERHSRDNQWWRIEALDDHRFRIASVYSGAYLTLVDRANGAPVTPARSGPLILVGDGGHFEAAVFQGYRPGAACRLLFCERDAGHSHYGDQNSDSRKHSKSDLGRLPVEPEVQPHHRGAQEEHAGGPRDEPQLPGLHAGRGQRAVGTGG